MPDDRLLAPVWEAAAAAHVPVLIHVADPLAFFLPADRHNERLEQLCLDRGARHGGGRERYERLIDALEHLVASQPSTAFIAAHGCCPHDLNRVAAMLERYPNLFVDVAAAVPELGRQPRVARSFITGHAGRVLFGTDVFPWDMRAQQTYFRLFETADDAFQEDGAGSGPCSRWLLYGLDLPTEVLERVYRDNAAALFGLQADQGQGRTVTAGEAAR